MNNDIDDMDELFREAAENYPLNTNSANWNKVMPQLHPAANDLSGKQQKKNFRYLWLLLLLPLEFICGKYINNYSINSKQTIFKRETNDEQSKTNNQQAINKPAVAVKQSDNKDEKSRVIKARFFNNTVRNTKKQTNSFVKPNRNFSLYTNQNTSPLSEVTKRTSDRNKFHTDNPYETETNTEVNDRLEPVILQLNSFAVGSIYNMIKHTMQDTDKSITVNLKSDSIVQPSARKTGATHNKNFFYAGIILGPDFSVVKNQKMKHTGSTIGIIAGYQLTKKLAIEAGGWWDKKNYYSRGEYFNTNKIPLPYNVKILTVDGSCNMVELPLNVRYNIFQNKKTAWFASAGVSSYFMKKEDYTYLYDHNSVQYNVSMSYKNSSKDLLSVMNISAGYQQQIGNAIIRIEPYFKVPLKGVGIGRLPITSTGLYVSISRTAHK